MVITPVLRGLFGIEIDAQKKTVTVNPHLPAGWDRAEVMRLQTPGGATDLYFTQKNGTLDVYMSQVEDGAWRLRSDMPGATFGPLERSRLPKKLKDAPLEGIRIPLSALDVDLSLGGLNVMESVAAVTPGLLPTPGAQTSKFRFIHTDYGAHKLVLTAEGLAGSTGMVRLMRRGHFIPKVVTEPSSAPEASASYRDCDGDLYACTSMPLLLNFPAGEGWKTITVILTW
jgi:hypothetical protein